MRYLYLDHLSIDFLHVFRSHIPTTVTATNPRTITNTTSRAITRTAPRARATPRATRTCYRAITCTRRAITRDTRNFSHASTSRAITRRAGNSGASTRGGSNRIATRT